jgi:hypothetical protein
MVKEREKLESARETLFTLSDLEKICDTYSNSYYGDGWDIELWVKPVQN